MVLTSTPTSDDAFDELLNTLLFVRSKKVLVAKQQAQAAITLCKFFELARREIVFSIADDLWLPADARNRFALAVRDAASRGVAIKLSILTTRGESAIARMLADGYRPRRELLQRVEPSFGNTAIVMDDRAFQEQLSGPSFQVRINMNDSEGARTILDRLNHGRLNAVAQGARLSRAA